MAYGANRQGRPVHCVQGPCRRACVRAYVPPALLRASPHVFLFIAVCMQQVLKQGHVGGLPPCVDATYNAFMQLALHCVRWGGGVPRTTGELALEERWVGPLVSNVFETAFGTKTGRLRWAGCVVLSAVAALAPSCDVCICPAWCQPSHTTSLTETCLSRTPRSDFMHMEGGPSCLCTGPTPTHSSFV